MGLSALMPGKGEVSHTGTLLGIIHELDDLAADLTAEGFHDEAESLETVTADLRWQAEELVRKEQLSVWPNGPRRLAL